jgi:hypothetical protein
MIHVASSRQPVVPDRVAGGSDADRHVRMTIHSIPPFSGTATPTAGNAGRLATGRPTGAGDGADRVNVSEHARVLSRFATELDPTPESLRRLGQRLADELARQLQRGGLDVAQPMAFEVDNAAGTVRVRADHPDATKIDTLLAGQPAIVRQIRDVAVVQRQVELVDSSSASATARRLAQDTAEAHQLIARFAPSPDSRNDGLPFASIARDSPAAMSRLQMAAAAYAEMAGGIATARVIADPGRATTSGRATATNGRDARK